MSESPLMAPERPTVLERVRVIDPRTGIDRAERVTLHAGARVPEPHDAALVDGSGLWLVPALVDLCSRLREPGDQQHGTLKSEGQAARRNGFAHVLLPPDTRPVLENGALLAGLRQRARDDGGIQLHVIGALTQGLEGSAPANLAGLKQGGCVAVSNARRPFASDEVLLRVLEYAATLGLTVFFYPQEASLAKDGCVHEGYIASRQGLTGIPELAETVALAKQLLMVEAIGVKAHFSQLSSARSVELIEQAKARGAPVTCDVAMHQLFLTDQAIEGFNALAHVYPPLRSDADREALRRGVQSGVIDAICSHHEPLSLSAKQAPFAETQAGISAVDTFVPLALRLVSEGVLTLQQLIEKISINPAAIAGLPAVTEWTLIDPNLAWVLSPDTMHSQGKNSPFLGHVMRGRAVI